MSTISLETPALPAGWQRVTLSKIYQNGLTGFIYLDDECSIYKWQLADAGECVAAGNAKVLWRCVVACDKASRRAE